MPGLHQRASARALGREMTLGSIPSSYAASFGYLVAAMAFPFAALVSNRSRLGGLSKPALVIGCLITAGWGLAWTLWPYWRLAWVGAAVLEVARSGAWFTFFALSLRSVVLAN
jgi:hypothetical protein